MAVVDEDRRYVAVNDAAAQLYQGRREEIVGRKAGTGIADEDPAIGERIWQELVRTGEYYGEQLVHWSTGPPLRVSYAAHATNLDQRWVALFVVLSAQVEPQGEELISAAAPGEASNGGSRAQRPETPGLSQGKGLTPRELEIVERVALGRSTPQIAADLNLSPATVRSHVRNAMVKTGAHTRAQLVALLLGDGLARR